MHLNLRRYFVHWVHLHRQIGRITSHYPIMHLLNNSRSRTWLCYLLLRHQNPWIFSRNACCTILCVVCDRPMLYNMPTSAQVHCLRRLTNFQDQHHLCLTCLRKDPLRPRGMEVLYCPHKRARAVHRTRKALKNVCWTMKKSPSDGASRILSHSRNMRDSESSQRRRDARKKSGNIIYLRTCAPRFLFLFRSSRSQFPTTLPFLNAGIGRPD